MANLIRELPPASGHIRLLDSCGNKTIFSVPPDVDSKALAFAVETRIVQLGSLLRMTHGEMGDAFREQDIVTQDSYLCTCNSLADELYSLYEILGEKRYAEKGRD